MLSMVLPFGRGAACNSPSGVVAIPDPKLDNPLAAAKGQETAVVAGGCFWGIQAVFEHLKGVIRATSGYSGGAANTAQYEKVCSGRTGHAEAVEMIFDPSQISYGQILKVFFSVAHDPTELNRQGPDVGTQYRSAIFYVSEEQKRIGEAYVKQLDEAKVFGSADRDADRSARCLLSRRGLSSGLRRTASREHVHCDQRSAEGGKPEEAIPVAL